MNQYRGKILRLAPNRVWRTYSGGLLLDRMEGRPSPADGDYPEDWLGSTVRAINPNRSNDEEGLARVRVAHRELLLANLIEADPEYFLGPQHVSRFGANPMLLVKYLDAVVRLPIQVHPTVDFSVKHLNTMSGKTEAYYILETRPEVTDPFIYLGFQRPPARSELRRMIVEQDIAGLESCFDKIPVKAGDVYVVPGGLPHAIGGGVLMVELMEPTDYVARVEFKIGSRVIPDSARFMGRDIEFALDMFSFDPWPLEAVQSRWRCKPEVVEEDAAVRRDSLVDERFTDRFRMARMHVSRPHRRKCNAFTILLVLEGSCCIQTTHDRVELSKYDRIVIPYGLGEFEIVPYNHVVLLENSSPASSGAGESLRNINASTESEVLLGD